MSRFIFPKEPVRTGRPYIDDPATLPAAAAGSIQQAKSLLFELIVHVTNVNIFIIFTGQNVS